MCCTKTNSDGYSDGGECELEDSYREAKRTRALRCATTTIASMVNGDQRLRGGAILQTHRQTCPLVRSNLLARCVLLSGGRHFDATSKQPSGCNQTQSRPVTVTGARHDKRAPALCQHTLRSPLLDPPSGMLHDANGQLYTQVYRPPGASGVNGATE